MQSVVQSVVRIAAEKILLCRAIHQVPLSVKTGAVAGALPGALFRIPGQLAAQVGTAAVFCGEAKEQAFSGFDGMGSQFCS